MAKKFNKKASKTIGLPPGTVFPLEERTEDVKITIIDYDHEKFQERQVKNIEECFPFKETPTVTWINVDGIHRGDVIEKTGKNFDLHPLILEDIVTTGQRPKYEDFQSYIYTILKMIYYDESNDRIGVEQVSLIIGKNYVISFQEKPGDVFNFVRERIRNDKGRVRKMGADYLAYALIDAIVDNYFLVIEKMGEKIEGMEDELVTNPTPKALRIIHGLKRDTIFLRKSIWPLREVVNNLSRGESALIKKATSLYLRDVYDHTIQIIDTIESFRDIVAGMLDIYLSSMSNRMNEIMKVLTIIATIFIPLTFVAGIYGMNFNTRSSPFNMPELNWRYGYLFALGMMAFIIITMVLYFRRKKWL
jgi:magnesium transporter